MAWTRSTDFTSECTPPSDMPRNSQATHTDVLSPSRMLYPDCSEMPGASGSLFSPKIKKTSFQIAGQPGPGYGGVNREQSAVRSEPVSVPEPTAWTGL